MDGSPSDNNGDPSIEVLSDIVGDTPDRDPGGGWIGILDADYNY